MFPANSSDLLLNSSPNNHVCLTHRLDRKPSLIRQKTRRSVRSRTCRAHGKNPEVRQNGGKSPDAILSFKNTSALCGDLHKLLDIPEICDVKFLVGASRTPVYGVKAILATRNRTFFNMILSKQRCNVHENQRHLPAKKMSVISRLKERLVGRKASRHMMLEVPEFDPDVFRKVIVYLQTGDVNVGIKEAIGLMNAADTYGLTDLRNVCHQFALRSLNRHSAVTLLKSAEAHLDFKWTKIITNEILDFISRKMPNVLEHTEFTSLSLETVVTLLSHSELSFSEEQKWDSAYKWARMNCGGKNLKQIKITLKKLASIIDFTRIPIDKILREIKPLEIVSSDVIKEAIAHWSCSKVKNVLVEGDEPISENFTSSQTDTIPLVGQKEPGQRIPVASDKSVVFQSDSSMLI